MNPTPFSHDPSAILAAMPQALLSLSPRMRSFAALCLALLAAACATPPEPVASAPEPLICPPVEKPVCPAAPAAPKAPPAAPVPEVEYRGRLQPASWLDMPDWGREPLRESLVAFVRGCSALEKQPAWQSVCAAAIALPSAATDREIAAFFETRFDPFQVINADESTSGMVTGYYEPLLRGSRQREQCARRSCAHR